MPSELLPITAPFIAQALSFAAVAAGEGIKRGLQTDLYAKLKDAVWNLIMVKKAPPEEVSAFTSLTANPKETDRHMDELVRLMERIEAHLDTTVADLARQVMETPEVQSVKAGRDNVNAGRDVINATGTTGVVGSGNSGNSVNIGK